MDNPDITYAIYIAATPEKLWKALTSPEALMKTWGRIESEWTVGSRVSEVSDSGKLLWGGEVLHSEPPRLLSFRAIRLQFIKGPPAAASAGAAVVRLQPQ